MVHGWAWQAGDAKKPEVRRAFSAAPALGSTSTVSHQARKLCRATHPDGVLLDASDGAVVVCLDVLTVSARLVGCGCGVLGLGLHGGVCSELHGGAWSLLTDAPRWGVPKG